MVLEKRGKSEGKSEGKSGVNRNMADIDRINDLVGKKDFQTAVVLIDEALAEDAENQELLKLAGLTYMNLNDWTKARKTFETIVKYNPDDASSWFYLGNSYDKLGDYVSAKNAYLKVVELRPNYTDAYKSLCIALMKLNEPKEAIKIANIASAGDAEDYIFDFIAGTAYMKIKDFAKSIEPLKKALEKAPNNISIYNSLGTSYMATGKFEEAIKSYKKALELNPKNPMAYYNIGSAYQVQQNHEAACEYLEKAVKLDESDESFKVALAMSEVKSGQYVKAADIYKKLLVQFPQKETYKYNLATCYEAMGEIQTAIALLEGVVYMNPKFILPAQKLASLYIKANQLAKAKEVYDKILLKNNPTPEILHQYAILSSSLCDTDTAEKMLKKVIQMNPDFAKAHKDLGIIYLNKRLFDYADDEFKTAMRLQPNDFEILFEYGNFLYSTSRNTEAERFYGEALDIEPDNVLALTFMGLNKLILNQLDEAKDYVLKALKFNPHHEYIQFCMGRILYARKEFEEAKHYLILAVEQNPDIETQNLLALTYYELGEYEPALNIFLNLLAKRPDNISVLMSLAKCYEGLKDNDKALEYLEKIVSVFPEDEEAHEMIRKLS